VTLLFDELDWRSLSDDAIDELTLFGHVFEAESYPDDPLTPIEVGRVGYRTVPEFHVRREFVARDGTGRVVAHADTAWARSEDNQHILSMWIGVRPDMRRRGLATRFMSAVVDVADEAGKSLVMFHTNDRVPAAEAFARHIGAEVGLVGHTNRLMIARVNRNEMHRWVTDGPVRAPGYSLLAIDGRYPDDLVQEIVDLWDVMNTAPRDNLDMEDGKTTVEQVREGEKGFFAKGGERWLLVARDDAIGALVGWTEVTWFPHEPATVWQFGTGVRPEHRGHALGKWMKAVMFERIVAERPQVVDVRTHNADSNDAMLGINKQMGFEPYKTDIDWQIRVEVLRDYVNGSST
jgi:mycothiol synthase